MFFLHHPDDTSHPYTLRLTDADLTLLLAEADVASELHDHRKSRELLDAWLILCADQIAAARRGLTSPEREARGLPLIRLGPGGDYVRDYTPAVDPAAEVLTPELLDVLA